MGCGSPKPVTKSEVENPCKELIQEIALSLEASRKNVVILEAVFYFLNQILATSSRSENEKGFSRVISTELTNFKGILPNLLASDQIKEEEILQNLLPVETAYNQLFPESAFDLKSKIKSLESIGAALSKKELDPFFLNEPADFWFKYFKNVKNSECTWQVFQEKFKTAYMSIFDKDLQAFPEKRPFAEKIKENLLLLIMNELQSQNNGNVRREGWNVFSFRVLFNFEARMTFVDRASVSPLKSCNNMLNLTFEFEDGRPLDPVEHQEYEISQERLLKKKEDEKVSKDLTLPGNIIKIGREKSSNDIVLTPAGVSRSHFQISMKRNIVEGELRNEFYMSNISKSFTYFAVEKAGYQLSEKMVISLSLSKEFYIKSMHPEYIPNSNYLRVEPEFLGENRKVKQLQSNKLPFIEIEFLDDARRELRSAKGENEDAIFDVGSGPSKKDSISVSSKDPETEEEEVINQRHCQILYDSKNKCWAIKDETLEKDRVYKTFITCYNNKQYAKNFEGPMRGIRLMDGMKLYFGNCAFNLKEIKNSEK